MKYAISTANNHTCMNVSANMDNLTLRVVFEISLKTLENI